MTRPPGCQLLQVYRARLPSNAFVSLDTGLSVNRVYHTMGVHVIGLIALLVFYVAILVIGIAAYCLKGRKKNQEEKGAETITVARRDIGWIIGGFTMTGVYRRLA